jgi:hypothetical protein
MRRDDIREFTCSKIFYELIDAVWGHGRKEPMIHLHYWSRATIGQALRFFQGEHAISGRAAYSDTEPLTHMLQKLSAATQHASDVRADRNEITSYRLAMKHIIERCSTCYFGRRDVQQLGYLLNSLRGKPTILFLGKVA